ncbi:MAG: hypothetical protein WCO84_06020 [bacterium]
MSNVLTNNTTGSIILTLNNTTYTGENIISMPPGSSVLYNDIVVRDQSSALYNVPLIQEYIDNGILLNQTLSGHTGSELQTLSPANLTINITTGIPKLLSNAKTSNNIDNQQLLVSNDATGKFQYIYYKSVQGMSISADFGASQSLISNANLLYPDEITSFAIQVYDSLGGILKQVNRLYIGTLREGVKTFTPGIDTTYVNFDENAVCPTHDNIDLIFKTTVTTIVNTVYPTSSDTVTSVTATFCPTYVLAIINNPYSSGCPIFISSRPRQTTITVDTTVHIDGTNTTTTSTVGPDYKTKVIYKYLHSQIYINDTKLNVSPSSWTLLQENTSPDIFPKHILNVITEYTPSGAVFLTKSNDSISNRLYKITCSSGTVTPGIPPTISGIASISEVTPLPVSLQNTKLKNISYLSEITDNKYDIFITTDSEVWRYSSYSSSWSAFISKNSLVSYLNISLENGVLSGVFGGTASFATNKMTLTSAPTSGRIVLGQKLACAGVADNTIITSLYSGTLNEVGSVYTLSTSPGTLTTRSFTSYVTYLKELSNFVMLPLNDTPNKYIGILGSELGLISFTLKLVNNIFTANSNNVKAQSIGIARYSVITDLKYNIDGQNMYIFTCSYSSQIPRTWTDNIDCLQVINNSSSLVNDVYYLKPDIENVSDLPYYVTENLIRINSIPSPEQISFAPVLIDANHSYGLISPKYSFKVCNFDDILRSALTSTLAYKYYTPYITERIISSVSPAELTSLELNEYKHAFKMDYLAFISINTDLGTQFPVSNQQTVSLDNVLIDSNSFLCISLDGSVVLPITGIQSSYEISTGVFVYSTILTFASAFSGIIYTQTSTGTTVPFTLKGLSAILDYSKVADYPSLAGRYPQVILDSSVADLLNDIKYIDSGRLEISFSSPVDTTINLK